MSLPLLIGATALIVHMVIGDLWFHYVTKRSPHLSQDPITYLTVLWLWPIGVCILLLGDDDDS